MENQESWCPKNQVRTVYQREGGSQWCPTLLRHQARGGLGLDRGFSNRQVVVVLVKGWEPKVDRSEFKREWEERNWKRQVESTLLRCLAAKGSKEMGCSVAGEVG